MKTVKGRTLVTPGFSGNGEVCWHLDGQWLYVNTSDHGYQHQIDKPDQFWEDLAKSCNNGQEMGPPCGLGLIDWARQRRIKVELKKSN
ncbi:MAG: hypothetical protein CMI55_01660 [Parcubacteria group bacterium]|jgi:sugar lactone lactonase YvrE|nr:hypothetical protein [Parcubacteria group bacterium]|tara:strand:- start:27 stop:290 length:264 start_codon:yes stop_codon:yes gene_type:complete